MKKKQLKKNVSQYFPITYAYYIYIYKMGSQKFIFHIFYVYKISAADEPKER